MTTENTLPRRLRVKPCCHIDGIVEGKRITPGLYKEGTNIDVETFEKLLSPEFAHAVETLESKPREEPLAQVQDAPKSEPGIQHLRKNREAAEREYKERWPGGRPVQYTETR